MTTISTAGTGLQASKMLASRIAASVQPSISALEAEDTSPSASTVLTLAGKGAGDVVYAKPKTADTALSVPIRAWASKQRDAITALMARNNGTGGAGSLADQWRGLGGALLSRLVNPESNYKQALVDRVPATDTNADTGTMTAERADALDAQALSGLQNGAATVDLTIQTRSGQTVTLKIAVNPGQDNGGGRGIQVELSSSGALSSTEREALAKLSEGLDKVLEGLGQADKLQLDLTGLMGDDSGTLASLDLTVQNPKAGQALSSFSLHLGTDRKAVSLQGSAGQIDLNLDQGMPLGPVDAQQRQSAIANHLRKFDAAADRGHADATLLALFKAAFTQLHAAPSGQAASGTASGALSPVLARQVQPLQSGLGDFQASFSGDTQRTNERGAVNEKGHASYQFSQKTAVKSSGRAGESSITQTQSEQLDAHYLRSRFGGMLDTGTGTYDIHKVSDKNTSTTRLEAAGNKLTQATRSTDQHQLKTFEQLENHRVKAQGGAPVNRKATEQLR